MRILQINIAGKKGSTGKIVTDLHYYLRYHGQDSMVLYGHTENISEIGYHQISHLVEARFTSQLCKLGRPVYKGNPWSLKRIKRLIKEYNPDIVHLHCINGFMCDIYKLLKYLATNKIHTIITHHAEFFYTGSCPYSVDCNQFVDNECRSCPRPRYSTFCRIFPNPHKNYLRMKESFDSFEEKYLYFVAVSPWVFNRSRLSPIVNKYQGKVILNGLDTSVFKYKHVSNDFIKSRFNITADKIVLHVTSQFSSSDKECMKGGGYITELAMRNQDIAFVVVSSTITIDSHLPPNLYIWGSTENQSVLADLYSACDLTIIVSKRETFSMIVAESLCCGTPVVGYEAGGPESIAIKNFSTFVEYGDIAQLELQIKKYLNRNFDKELISKKSQIFYSSDKMGQEYLQLYNEFLNQ